MNSIVHQVIEENLKSQRASIQEVLSRSRMFDADVVEMKGRMLKIDGHWLADFASCNYLGFDLDQEMMDSIEPELKKWGVHPSWCRLVSSPHIYTECEERLAELMHAPDFLMLPTVTLVHIGVIPALMGKDGVMLLDKFGHMTMYQGCKMARDSGSALASFPQGDLNRLEELLKQHQDKKKKLILLDGVYSMTGKYPDLPAMVKLAREHGAILYVDDAHGWGVIGEKPTKDMPYGHKGNGIAAHFGLDYENDHVMYVTGFSKAYSSLSAGLACSKELKSFLKAYATPYDLSGPCPTASLATTLSGMLINEKKGEALRKKLLDLTRIAIKGLRELGFFVDNDNDFPILSVWVGDNERLIEVSKILWDAGVLLTLGPYPMIPRGHEELRITLTAANTEAEVHEHLLKGFAKVRDHLTKIGAPLQPPKS